MLGSEPKAITAKVAGGFVLPLVWQLFAAWWCYREGLMPLRALRVWLALWEMQARRCRLRGDRTPRLRLPELQRLVGGVGGAHLRRDLARLRALGLVAFEDGHIRFLQSPEQLRAGDLDVFWAALQAIPNAKRRVPLPRRALRYLAGCGVRVLLATALAEAIRLLYYRNGEVGGRGRCKASWVASAFRVDLRGAKRARAHLTAIGLLVPEGGVSGSRERVFERRWGKSLRWNLVWEGVAQDAPEPATDLPPQTARSATGLPPVESDKTLLSESEKHQKPGLPGSAAGSFEEGGGQPAVTLAAIESADLTNAARSFALYRDAVAKGFLEASEASEIRFFGLIAHARRYGTRNPAGLLRALLTRRRWHFVTQDDEEEARGRLRSLRFGEVARPRPAARDERHDAEPGRIRSILAGFLATLSRQGSWVDRGGPSWRLKVPVIS